ncbi:MAG: hypothetical protein ACRCY3_08865, partial [Sphingorhabdus sp.]
MSEDPRNRILGVEVQHIFVSEIANSDSAARGYALLQSINFNLESRSNKVALLARNNVRDAILNAPNAVQEVFIDAGFGWNTQNSFNNPNAHPEYNAFNIEALNELARDADAFGWDRQAKERAVFDLHRFMASINDSGFPPVQGSTQAAFDQAWAAWRGNRNYASLSAADAQAIDTYSSSFIITAATNTEVRADAAQALYDAAADILTDDERSYAQTHLQKGNITAAFTALIYDLQSRSSSPVVGVEVAAEGWAAKLSAIIPDFIDFDALYDKLKSIFGTVAGYADSLADSVSALGDDLIASMGKSVNAMLVGLGGNAIGDFVEFLNMAYEPIKKGFKTGDWSDFGATVAQYGVAAAVSAVLVIGSVAVASFFAGPIAAAFVAAGWAAWGLYDAITNGVELLGKISADLADVIPKIGEAIENFANSIVEYANVIDRIVSNAMDVDFNAPVFAGAGDPKSLVRKYLVDPLDPSLPASIRGTEAAEHFFGKNTAVIDAGGGNDEVYARGTANAQGGAGNDVLAGAAARYISAGELLDPAKTDGPRADADMQMRLDGGTGDDWVIAIDGDRAVTIGGLGRDWVYNTSAKGILWGDIENSFKLADGSRGYLAEEVNAQGQVVQVVKTIADDASNADVFWYASDTTIMDAGKYDRLKLYGITL